MVMARTLRLLMLGEAATFIALLGTLVGIVTIIMGIGPQSVPDVVYHIFIVAVLAWGLAMAPPARVAV